MSRGGKGSSATGNVSTRAKHAITSGNAVGISNSFCYLTFKQFPSQTIDTWQSYALITLTKFGGWARFGGLCPLAPT